LQEEAIAIRNRGAASTSHGSPIGAYFSIAKNATNTGHAPIGWTFVPLPSNASTDFGVVEYIDQPLGFSYYQATEFRNTGFTFWSVAIFYEWAI
jgi:hypothetical protein